jgi:hypothetical protein
MPYVSLVFIVTFCLVLLSQLIVIGIVFANQRHKGQCTVVLYNSVKMPWYEVYVTFFSNFYVFNKRR